jgi:4-amino-4-deoxy-L-arabinose transferase-like glycosyltransferase
MNKDRRDRFIALLSSLAHDKRVLWLLFALAMVTRLIGVAAGGTRAEDDDHWHLQIARNFLAGNGMRLDIDSWPTYSYIQPGFAVIHIVFMSLFNNFFLAERIFLLLFSSITIVLFFLLCKRLFSPVTALMSTLWLIFYPPQWFWMTRLNPHSFATNMLVIAFLLLFIAWDKKSIWLGFAVGYLWGALTLMRPEYELGIFCLAFASFIFFANSRQKWSFCVVLIVGWMAFLAPWVIRNYRIHGRPVIATTHYGINLWMVAHPDYHFDSSSMVPSPELAAKLAKEPNEVKRADLYVAEAKRYIRNNPKLFFRHALGNLAAYWRPWLSPKVTSLTENLVYTCSYVPLFMLFLIGLWKMPWRDPRWIAVTLFLLYKMLAHIPFYMIVRFREATMPLMLLIATIPLNAWLSSGVSTQAGKDVHEP